MKLEDKINISRSKKDADLVIKNAKIIDVFGGGIIEGDLAISSGIIMGVGDYNGISEIDIGGKYISPTLIDSHVHIESSMVTLRELSKVLVPNGVTTIVADPHEIANVYGVDGIKYLIEASEDLGLDVKIMLPSCVPATPFENSGAILGNKELLTLKGYKSVIGLGEMMNYVGLLDCDPEVMEKIKSFGDSIIDGHAPGLIGNDLNAYALSGVKTDHECSTIDEMNDRISRGMYVHIRQGTSAQNAEVLIKGITKDNLSRVLFCTDDKHPKDLLEKGSINENIKIAIKNGVDPIDAIKIASINAAKCYNLKQKGAIAPGYEGSFIILNNLEEFEIDKVYVKGKEYTQETESSDEKLYNVNLKDINVYNYALEDLEIKLDSNYANIIALTPNELLTKKLVEKVNVSEGYFVPDQTYQKLIVIERHNGLRSIGKGIIKGFGIKGGAIASTIAHDSHNIIIVGDNDEDMYCALQEIIRINGGIVVAKDEQILSSLPLEIGGLISTLSIEETNERLESILYEIRTKLGVTNRSLDPILTLGFMSLPVIPEIKLTDRGLFDVTEFEFIDINP